MQSSQFTTDTFAHWESWQAYRHSTHLVTVTELIANSEPCKNRLTTRVVQSVSNPPECNLLFASSLASFKSPLKTAHFSSLSVWYHIAQFTTIQHLRFAHNPGCCINFVFYCIVNNAYKTPIADIPTYLSHLTYDELMCRSQQVPTAILDTPIITATWKWLHLTGKVGLPISIYTIDLGGNAVKLLAVNASRTINQKIKNFSGYLESCLLYSMRPKTRATYSENKWMKKTEKPCSTVKQR